MIFYLITLIYRTNHPNQLSKLDSHAQNDEAAEIHNAIFDKTSELSIMVPINYPTKVIRRQSDSGIRGY